MKKLIFVFLLSPLFIYAQSNNIIGRAVAEALVNSVINSLNEPVSTQGLYRYSKFNGFKYDYSYKDLNLLVEKQFKINKLTDLTEEKYKNLNLDVFNSNTDTIGLLKYSDTLYYPQNLNFDDANFIVSDILSNNYFRVFHTNKYGLYFIEVLNSYYFLSDILLNLKINVYKNCLTITSYQKLNLPIQTSTNFLEPRSVGAFNSHELGYLESENIEYEGWYDENGKSSIQIKYNNKQAYKQLIYLASLNETRQRIKKYFGDYLIEISKSKR